MTHIRHTNGALAELVAQMHYVKDGFTIFSPQGTHSKCDFIADKRGESIKVQVKKASWSRAGDYSYLQARLVSRNTKQERYQDGDWDEVVFVGDTCIWIAPWSDVKELTSVCLDGTKEDYKSRSTLYDPDEWII